MQVYVLSDSFGCGFIHRFAFYTIYGEMTGFTKLKHLYQIFVRIHKNPYNRGILIYNLTYFIPVSQILFTCRLALILGIWIKNRYILYGILFAP